MYFDVILSILELDETISAVELQEDFMISGKKNKDKHY